MRIGKNMRHALAFARKYNSWTTYANDRATTNAINRLVSYGLVEINTFNQFRAI